MLFETFFLIQFWQYALDLHNKLIFLVFKNRFGDVFKKTTRKEDEKNILERKLTINTHEETKEIVIDKIHSNSEKESVKTQSDVVDKIRLNTKEDILISDSFLELKNQQKSKKKVYL